MTTLYEVTLKFDAAIAEEYDVWLEQHVEEMLALPGFVSAEISTIEEGDLSANEVGRVVHYRLEDRAAFDAYLRNHAAGMRDEGIQRFGDRARASRRLLRPVR
ncbi:MAG: DUF4286 family protein [Gammaproteobacteria bacterium]|nr:DUF4286 family protein [Gammaproteobacteria bacterium]